MLDGPVYYVTNIQEYGFFLTRIFPYSGVFYAVCVAGGSNTSNASFLINVYQANSSLHKIYMYF